MDKFEVMERNLVYGMIETMNKQDILLSDDNISYFIKEALNSIIIYNRYNFFTNRNNARNKVREYKPEEYLELISDRLDNFFKKENSVKNGITVFKNGDSYIDSKKLQQFINLYADEIFLGVVGEELFDKRTSVDNSYFDKLINKVSNRVFYKPTNECRKAVMEGRQTSVKLSSEKVCGMQAYSDVGKIRKNQEDSYYIGTHPKLEKFKIMLVADGMGGQSNGEIASNMAAKEMMLFFEKLPGKEFYDKNNDVLMKKIVGKVLEIDKKIKAVANGGGTTLCFAILKDKQILLGNVGDSRGIVMENGELIYSTISQNMPVIMGIPEPFDRFHPRSNIIYNALGCLQDGAKDGGIDFGVIGMDDNKTYDVVLCSDGVSDCLSNEQIQNVVNTSYDEKVASNLVKTALNSYSDFGSEFSRYSAKVRSGVVSISDWNNLNRALEYGGLNVNTALKIRGGKDNTTAVSSRIVRKK